MIWHFDDVWGKQLLFPLLDQPFFRCVHGFLGFLRSLLRTTASFFFLQPARIIPVESTKGHLRYQIWIYIYIYVQCTWRGINIYVYIAFAVYLHMCTLTVPTYKTAIVINIIEYNWHVRGCFLKNCMLETSHERTHVAIHIFCIVLQHDPCSKHLKSTV